MSNKKTNTDDILDAIKNMMSEKGSSSNQGLSQDIIELTNPIDQKETSDNELVQVLELSNPISDESNQKPLNKNIEISSDKAIQINEVQIREAVKSTLESMPSSTIDKIINEELTKIIKEKLVSSKITISSENKQN